MNKNLIFAVQGSKGDEYEIEFTRMGIKLRVSCTCPAGDVGIYCKHRLSLLEGEVDSLLSGNEDELLELPPMIAGTDLETALARYRHAERVYLEAKRELNGAKKALARTMCS